MAAPGKPNSEPSWSDVKAKLVSFDRSGLLGLVQDLYAASKENRIFLHARFALGEDILEVYKAAINRWLWPDGLKKQVASVANAKKAIADYRKAVGQAEGLAELMVFYCERAAGFTAEVGFQDERYFDALVRMFEQALKVADGLPVGQRQPLHARLVAVCDMCQDFGYGVVYEMGDLLAEFDVDVGSSMDPGACPGPDPGSSPG